MLCDGVEVFGDDEFGWSLSGLGSQACACVGCRRKGGLSQASSRPRSENRGGCRRQSAGTGQQMLAWSGT